MTGGLVLGEALNLWIPAEQMILDWQSGCSFWCACLPAGRADMGCRFFFCGRECLSDVFRMGGRAGGFSRKRRFREEHEDGVVLRGTVQSVKEKDGTLEVVLRGLPMEEEDGESGEKLPKVLCYLDVEDKK